MSVLTVNKTNLHVLQRVLDTGEGKIPASYKELSTALRSRSELVVMVRPWITGPIGLDGVVQAIDFKVSDIFKPRTDALPADEVFGYGYVHDHTLAYSGRIGLNLDIPKEPQINCWTLKQTLGNACKANTQMLTGVDIYSEMDTSVLMQPNVLFTPENLNERVLKIELAVWWRMSESQLSGYLSALAKAFSKHSPHLQPKLQTINLESFGLQHAHSCKDCL